MIRLITAILLCLTVVGCITDSREEQIIARARVFALSSPECRSVLDRYPGILDNAQMLPSQCPSVLIAFDHDELIRDKTQPNAPRRLNVRILVDMDGSTGSLRSIEVKETTY